MRLEDIVRRLEDMSDEELLERLREIKRRRTVERPAYKARVEREERKVVRGKAKRVSALLDALDPAAREALIKQLQQELE